MLTKLLVPFRKVNRTHIHDLVQKPFHVVADAHFDVASLLEHEFDRSWTRPAEEDEGAIQRFGVYDAYLYAVRRSLTCFTVRLTLSDRHSLCGYRVGLRATSTRIKYSHYYANRAVVNGFKQHCLSMALGSFGLRVMVVRIVIVFSPGSLPSQVHSRCSLWERQRLSLAG